MGNMGKKLAENSFIIIVGFIASIIAIYTFITGVDNINSLLFEQPSPTAPQQSLVVDFLGQVKIRRPESPQNASGFCDDIMNYLDVYSFVVINNDQLQNVSLYKVDMTFKLGDKSIESEDLSSKPQYTISLPISDFIEVPVIQENPFSTPEFVLNLDKYLYSLDTNLSLCSPGSTESLPITIPSKQTANFSIGILFDFNATDAYKYMTGEYYMILDSYVAKQIFFLFHFSDGNIIKVEIP
jgi:hypothetical protein